MIVVYALLALVGTLAAVLVINTLVQTQKARKLGGENPTVSDRELEAYGRGLQAMIQCATVSVKDQYDDGEFAKLRQVARELFPLLHEKAQRMTFSDDCWMFMLPGKDPSRNIMLMSHHDVVKAGENWKHDPFAGQIQEGKIWGRGTADTKGSLYAEMAALEELLREGFEPACNVYLGSSHNEELGGDGIPKALEYFQSQGITFEVILDEGGAIIDPPLKGMACDMAAMVAVHEKGRCKLKCVAQQIPGHSSLTQATRRSGVERMSSFIHEVTTGDLFIRRLNPQVRAMFSSLAPYCGFPMRLLFTNLWLFGPVLRRILPKLNAQAGGMLGSTCTFRELTESQQGVSCTAMIRYVDDRDMQQDLKAFRALAQKHGITLEDAAPMEYYPPAVSTEAAYDYTFRMIGQVFPRYPAAPYILPAGTDAWRLTQICPCVMRFAPTRLSAGQLSAIHGDDENIDVAAIAEAVVFYKRFVTEYQ